MSLIEKAIEKMRANEASLPARGGRPAPRPVGSASRAEITAELPAVHAVAAAALPPRRKLLINIAALRESGYFPEQGSDARFANYYHQIKRPLLQRAFESADHPEMRLVLLTSALPGDGKSFTSINLAFSLARERDSSVLLVDADVPKPNISQVLGMQEERGLLDAATDESVDPESLVMSTDIPGLEVLPSGTPVVQATELLASARMREVVLRLCHANPRRIVLLDAPPLLPSSEARSMLSLPGQAVLVVRAGKTPRGAVREAVNLIDGQKLTGLVLNEGSGGLDDSYSGYGYGTYGLESKSGAGGS